MPPVEQRIEELERRVEELIRASFPDTLEVALDKIDDFSKSHNHNGENSAQINVLDLFGEIPSNAHTDAQTIATTGNTDWFIIAGIGGTLVEIDFSGGTALTANDTNYITFSITNLGRDGAGTTALLAATDANTTKATGGSGITLDAVRELVVSTTQNAGKVSKGDRLRIRAAATGTLANTVANSVFTLRFK